MSIPEYLGFSKLRKVWSPADSAKLAEHASKFQGLPLMAPVTRAFMPEFDGDLAELADRVIAGIGARTGVACIDDDDIYEQMCWWFNLSSWPTDHVAELLADWPTPIIDGVTGQAAVA